MKCLVPYDANKLIKSHKYGCKSQEGFSKTGIYLFRCDGVFNKFKNKQKNNIGCFVAF